MDKPAERLKKRQARLGKNRRHSGKPPSSDGYGKPAKPAKRTESLRQKGQKSNGGQPGHQGETLKPSATPDKRQTHGVEHGGACGVSLKDVEVTGQEERQVFDIPAVRLEITAPRVEIKSCPNGSSRENRGEYPAAITAPVHYGNGVKTWASYFTNPHFVALERTAQIFEDRVHHRVSEAVILNASEELSERVEPVDEAVKVQLLEAAVNHQDESGLRVEGKLHGLHVTSTPKLTHYQIHARGQEAINEDDILPQFKGTVVHDHWKPYFTYDGCSHAWYNEPHRREAQYLEKHYGQAWAAEMSALLLEIKKAVDERRLSTNILPTERIKEFDRRYDEIVRRGYEANPRPPPPTEGTQKKRGRSKPTPPLNFLDRLKDFKPQVLAFRYDFRVPFSNNQAEPDVRMMKVKQKVSGSLRTQEGAKRFARIRGDVSTAGKNAVNVFAAIRDAFDGKPFIPSPQSR